MRMGVSLSQVLGRLHAFSRGGAIHAWPGVHPSSPSKPSRDAEDSPWPCAPESWKCMWVSLWHRAHLGRGKISEAAGQCEEAHTLFPRRCVRIFRHEPPRRDRPLSICVNGAVWLARVDNAPFGRKPIKAMSTVRSPSP